jgi:hypothetical protein
MAMPSLWGSLSQKKVDKNERAEEGKREEQKGATEWSRFTGIWSFVLPVMAESGEGFL